MRKIIWITVALLLFITQTLFAANWYVRPNGGSYGSENGSNWSNAFDGFSDISWASLSCGDTVWVAGGTYTQNLTIQKKCTSGSQLYIRRARTDASECTGATGWSSGYASTVHQVNTGIRNNGDYDYVTVSGRTTSSGGSHGWYIDYTGATSGSGIEFANGADVDYCTFEYMDIQGPGYVSYSNDGRGLDITPGYSVLSGHNTYSHLKVWDWESGVYCGWSEYETFEYIEIYNLRAVNWVDYHPNGFYLHDANHITIRYGNFHGYFGEGIFFTNNDTNIDGAYIYGNLFYNFSGSTVKAIQPDNQGTTNDIHIVNNTFDSTYFTLTGDGVSPATNSETKNNIFSRCLSGCGTLGTASNNISTSTDLFVDRSGGDYHLDSATTAGATLSSPYNSDPDGETRGADGTWDIGAYEYTGVDSSPPTISGNPTISTNGTTVTITFNETVVTTGYDNGDFDLDCSTAGDNISLNSISGSGSSRTFTAASTIGEDETCNLDYTGGANEIEDEAGNDLAAFSNDAVTNNSTYDITPPYADGQSPADEATDILESTNIVVHVKDDDAGVDSGTISMTVEGSGVSFSTSGTQSDYTLTYSPPSDFSYEQVVNVTIDADDNNGNSMTQDAYSFTIRSEPETIDLIDPIITITTPEDNPHDNGSDQTADLAGTASDEGSGIAYITWSCVDCEQIAGDAVDTSAGGDWSTWSISDIPLSEWDNNTVIVTAIDNSSNVNTANDSVVFTYSSDTSLPVQSAYGTNVQF